MSTRRSFLKTAGVLSAGAATGAVACDVKDTKMPELPATDVRALGFDRSTLDALASAVLPASLGATEVRAATTRFVTWADGYDPVAEEMHGYGYADIRYLPADPSPAWRAQLSALDTLARRSTGQPFVSLDVAGRQKVLSAALRRERGDQLPDPLVAEHVAVALMSHWAASPAAWNIAMGVQVTPKSCRPLNEATRIPLPVVQDSGARA